MDSPAADYLRHRLIKFAQSVDDITLHFHELDSFGPWRASMPFSEKNAIALLLESYDCEEPDRRLLGEEYSRISRDLESFKKRKGQEYRDLLFSDLRVYVHMYHAAICTAHLGQTGPRTISDLSQRELIGVLYRELKDHYDLSGIEDLIAMLDTNLTGTDLPVQDLRDSSETSAYGERSRAPSDRQCTPGKKVCQCICLPARFSCERH